MNELIIKDTIKKIVALEEELKEYKEIEKRRDNLKEDLKKYMETCNVKNWETPNGIKIALVADTPDTWQTVTKYNEAKFALENPEFHKQWMELHEKYKETTTEIKKGRKGYVKITLPKESSEADGN